MPTFLTTRRISSELEQLIKETTKTLYLVTPYLKLSSTLLDRLKIANQRGTNLVIIHGKNMMDEHQSHLLDQLNASVYFKENLHAKCYLNEHTAIITSMNLYSFSEVNNIEMGVMLKAYQDKEAFKDCTEEVLATLSLSQLVGGASIPVSALVSEQPMPGIGIYGSPVGSSDWVDALNNTFSQGDYANFNTGRFSSKEGVITAYDFPSDRVNFDNSYGFAAFNFSCSDRRFKSGKPRVVNAIKANDDLYKYRVYWHDSDKRVCLYIAKNVSFETQTEWIAYQLHAVKLLGAAVMAFR